MLYMVLIIMEIPDLISSILEEGLHSNGTGTGEPWANLLQSAMRNMMSRPTPTESTTEPTTPPTEPRSIPIEPRSNNNITPLIDNLIYEYSRNMRDYNKNIQEIIQLLRLTQQNVEPVSLFTYTYYPNTNANTNTSVNPLTTDEIAYATRTYSYTNNTPSNNEEPNRCPISLETFQVGDVICEIRGCGHIFKRPPLMRWFQRNSQCPMCRYQLREYQQPEPEPQSEPRQSEETIERIVRELLSQPNNNNNNNPNIDPVD